MSQNQIRKLAFLAVWLGVASLLPFGCNLFSHNTICVFPQPNKQFEYPLVFNEGPKKGQDLAAAVFVEYASGTDFAFAGSEAKLAAELVRQLSEAAQECKQTLKVIDPARENSVDPHNPNWKLMYTGEWGQKHFVSFVLTVQLDKLAIYQPGSNNRLYQGQAEVTVDVDEVEAGKTKPKYHYVMSYKYPETGTLDATSLPVTRFRQDFLEHLAAAVSEKHFGKKPATPDLP